MKVVIIYLAEKKKKKKFKTPLKLMKITKSTLTTHLYSTRSCLISPPVLQRVLFLTVACTSQYMGLLKMK